MPRSSAVVPGQANAEPVAIHANHKEMVRFKSRTQNYSIVLENLKIMVQQAPEVIQTRWLEEIRINEGKSWLAQTDSIHTLK